jgi:hypothetical protein
MRMSEKRTESKKKVIHGNGWSILAHGREG